MDQHPESDPEQELNTSVFCDYVNANPSAAYEQWQQAQQSRYNLNVTLPSDQPAPPPLMYPIIDPQTLASIVAQVMAQTITQQSLPPPPVINLPSLLLQATAPAIHQSEKLPDTAEYDRDRDCLDAWEQSLRQRLHMNHD